MKRYVVGVLSLFDAELHLFDRRAESKLEAARGVILELWESDACADIPGIDTFEELVVYLNECDSVLQVLELDSE